MNLRDERRHRRLAREHRFSGQQPVRDASDRVEIGAAVDVRLAERQFGRHVGRRTGRRMIRRQLRHRRMLGHLDETEVEHLDEIPVGTQTARENIRRLDVAMDQAGAVRFCQ